MEQILINDEIGVLNSNLVIVRTLHDDDFNIVHVLSKACSQEYILGFIVGEKGLEVVDRNEYAKRMGEKYGNDIVSFSKSRNVNVLILNKNEFIDNKSSINVILWNLGDRYELVGEKDINNKINLKFSNSQRYELTGI